MIFKVGDRVEFDPSGGYYSRLVEMDFWGMDSGATYKVSAICNENILLEGDCWHPAVFFKQRSLTLNTLIELLREEF